MHVQSFTFKTLRRVQMGCIKRLNRYTKKAKIRCTGHGIGYKVKAYLSRFDAPCFGAEEAFYEK